MSLTSNNERRADLLISIVKARQENLIQLFGTAYEPQAAKDLEAAIERAANAILELEGEQREVYKAQLSTFILETKSTPIYPRLQKPFQQVLTKLAQELVDADTSLPESELEETSPSASPEQSLKVSSFQLMLATPNNTWDEFQSLPVGFPDHDFDPHASDERCANCHSFKGVCLQCHQDVYPEKHFTVECTVCHNYQAWQPVVIDHIASGFFDCSTCHEILRPADHYSGECSLCHQVTSWLPANFSHTTIGTTTCITCHAAHAPAGHYSLDCSVCHSPMSWLPAFVDHSNPEMTDCLSCHFYAQPPNHYNLQCSLCHVPVDWSIINFNHKAAGALDCRTCHKTDAPSNHYDAQCSACHTTTAWLPADFNHQSINTTNCLACH
ncbi:MAG: hypothetical protein R6V73_11445, partial [Anaerolineales bacterium]